MDHCACYTSTIVILKYAFCSARLISVTKTVAFSDLQGIQVAARNDKGGKGGAPRITVRMFHDLLEQRRVILLVLPMFTAFSCGRTDAGFMHRGVVESVRVSLVICYQS